MNQAPNNTEHIPLTVETLLAKYNEDPRSSSGMDTEEFDKLAGIAGDYYEVTAIYEVIAQKQVTLYLNENKLDNSLYMTLKKLNSFVSDDDDNNTVYHIAFLNPYFYALKKNMQFRNRNNKELVTLIFQFLFVQGKEIFLEDRKDRNIGYSKFNTPNVSSTEKPGGTNIKLTFAFTPYVNKQLVNDLIEYANKHYLTSNYYQVLQNNQINALIKADTKNIAQLDLNNTGIIEVNKDFRLFINDYKKPITNEARKCLDLLLIAYSESPQCEGRVQIPLEVYRQRRGFKNISTARKSAYKAITELHAISYEVDEYIKGKRVKSGIINISGGNSLIYNGVIYWDFNPRLLKNTFGMDINKKCFKLDDKKNPNAYNMARFIELNFRRNEGKARVNKISIKTMIENCPDLNATSKSCPRSRRKEKVMHPFLRDLYYVSQNLEFYFDVLDTTGGVVDDPGRLSFSDFQRCYLSIDYSEHPQHADRIARKKTYKKRVKAAKETNKNHD